MRRWIGCIDRVDRVDWAYVGKCWRGVKRKNRRSLPFVCSFYYHISFYTYHLSELFSVLTISPLTVSVDQMQPPSTAARLQQNIGMDVDQIVPEPRSQGHGGSHSAPPSSNDYVSHQQPLQQLQQQQSLATTEYTAWTIGSTETIKNNFANNSASAQASSSNSVYSSAILAKCSSRQASPAPTERRCPSAKRS